MIQEYISAYPQGLSLGEQQKMYVSVEQPIRYHRVLCQLTEHYTVQQLTQRVQEILASQLILGFVFDEVEGFRGKRQIPHSLIDIEITERSFDEDQSIDLISVAALVPVELSPELGRNLQIVLLKQGHSHSLLLRVNALCIDLASAELLAQWLSDSTIALPEAIQYPDFLAWLEELNGSEEAQQGKAYWQQYLTQLNAFKSAFSLPYHKAPEAADFSTQRRILSSLSTETVNAITDTAVQLEMNVSTIYQASWWLLLARISQNDHFVVGLGYDPRLVAEELAGGLGVYSQVLPVLVPKREDQTLANWFHQIGFTIEQHTEWAENYAQPEQKIECSTSIHVGNAILSDDKALDAGIAQELILHVEENGDEVLLKLQYASEAYSDEAALILLSQYAHLLSRLPELLMQSVATFSIATEAENKRHIALNAQATLDVSLLLNQLTLFAQTTPQALALQEADISFDYQTLNTLVIQTAAVLREKGVQHNDIVALSLTRSWQQVVVLLAVMRAGASYCPIDPAWPAQRQAQIIEVAAPKLIITSTDSNEGLSVSTLLELTQSVDIANIMLALPVAEQAAYVLFTSGSTGVPKGVVIEHAQLAQYCAASSAALSLAEQRRYALTSTVAADLGNTCLFNAFYNGAALVVANELQALNGVEFGHFVVKHQIDCIKIVPSHLQALLESEPAQLPKKVILGGETSPPALLQKIHKLSPLTVVYNHYGPTETTVGVLSHYYPVLNLFSATVPKLSTVFNGTQIYILNEHNELVATGEQGQLFIAGKQLARGYLNQPHNEAFIDQSRWASRLYTTGDLARYMPDGSISLSGRQDDQVKIRGFRVEPNDVATAIARHLTDCHVHVAVQKQGNEDCLVAFLVGYGHAGVKPLGLLVGEDSHHLQLTLRDLLPDAMVPAFFVALTSLPLLQNGKVDRKALPKVSDLSLATHVDPKTQLETLLANTLAEVLEVQKVSCDKSFFDLGGHSLSAIKFVTRVKKLLLVDIKPGLVFDNPTIQSLAEALNKQSNDASRLEKLALTQVKLAQLTPEQQAALRQKMGLAT